MNRNVNNGYEWQVIAGLKLLRQGKTDQIDEHIKELLKLKGRAEETGGRIRITPHGKDIATALLTGGKHGTKTQT